MVGKREGLENLAKGGRTKRTFMSSSANSLSVTIPSVPIAAAFKRTSGIKKKVKQGVPEKSNPHAN